jgi:L-malate glycosyltransferase
MLYNLFTNIRRPMGYVEPEMMSAKSTEAIGGGIPGPDVPIRQEKREAALSTRRRRVFFVLDSLNVGGTETQAVELALRLDPASYNVTLACLGARGPLLDMLKDSAVRLMEFYPRGGMNSPSGIYQLLRMAVFLRRGRFDVVHAHDLWANLLAVPAAWIARVPVIICSQRDLSHDDWYKTKRRKWLRRIQNLSNAVLTNAESIRGGLIDQERLPPDKVRVICNGIDLNRFNRVLSDHEHLLPCVGEGKVIVLVGNMVSDVKGHPWLIAAAPAIVREFPDTHFVLVGDGAQRAEFERQVSALALQGNFMFLGRRGDIPDILACCDIGVLPSRAEGMPNAVLEYLASGLPTIATNVGGSAEIIRNGVTGLLVPTQDSDALGQAILRLLRDPCLMRVLAENGQRYVRENFSFDRLIEQVDGLYTELLESRGRGRA